MPTTNRRINEQSRYPHQFAGRRAHGCAKLQVIYTTDQCDVPADTVVHLGDPRVDQVRRGKPATRVRWPPRRIAVLLVYRGEHPNASREVTFGSPLHSHLSISRAARPLHDDTVVNCLLTDRHERTVGMSAHTPPP